MTSNEGDIVLDPTAGSGTTGVAAAQLGRQYVLFDISPDAIESCIRRIRLEGNNS